MPRQSLLDAMVRSHEGTPEVSVRRIVALWILKQPYVDDTFSTAWQPPSRSIRTADHKYGKFVDIGVRSKRT